MEKFTLLLIFLLFNCVKPKFNEQIRDDLKKMVEMDQIAANIPKGLYIEYPKEKWRNFQDSVFNNNKNKVEKLYRKYGFLGINRVGEDGSFDFWLLVQHCDNFPEFQREVLKSMKREVKRKNAEPNNYAYLIDRVKVNNSEKQFFGTQVTYQESGRAIPKIGLFDSLNVDRRRLKYSLATLKDYLNEMTKMHFEMNKEHYLKVGILKPNLYE